MQPVFTVTSTYVSGPIFTATSDPSGDNLFGGRSVGNTSNVFRVDAAGAVYADGGYHTGGADFAEAFSVKGTTSTYAAGDVLTIDPGATRRLARSSRPYSTPVAGIYSTKPGVLASPYPMDTAPKSDIPLASGRSSSLQGDHGKRRHQAGRSFGYFAERRLRNEGDRSEQNGWSGSRKALEPLTKGEGVIQVLVNCNKVCGSCLSLRTRTMG